MVSAFLFLSAGAHICGLVVDLGCTYVKYLDLPDCTDGLIIEHNVLL
jgi:hypothetical protein